MMGKSFWHLSMLALWSMEAALNGIVHEEF